MHMPYILEDPSLTWQAFCWVPGVHFAIKDFIVQWWSTEILANKYNKWLFNHLAIYLAKRHIKENGKIDLKIIKKRHQKEGDAPRVVKNKSAVNEVWHGSLGAVVSTA